jgi:hypothetical protein
MLPLSLDQVKPNTEFFPLFPGRDTAAMREAEQLFVPHVFADKADARLGGSKKDIFRLIEFKAAAKAAANLPAKGHADRDIEVLAAELNCSELTIKEYLRQLAADQMIYQYRRRDKRWIIVLADPAGCAHLQNIIRAEQELSAKAAAKKAHAKSRYAETAALRAAKAVPVVDTDPEPAAPAWAGFYFASKSKIFCAKAQNSLQVRQFSLCKGETFIAETPRFFGAILSKNGVSITIPITFSSNSSSSSYLKRPCVDSGRQADDDDVEASLSEEEEEQEQTGQELPSALEGKDAPGADDIDPFADYDVPVQAASPAPIAAPAALPAAQAAMPTAQVVDPAEEEYESLVCYCIEVFCPIHPIEPQPLRDALEDEFNGARPETRNRILSSVIKRYEKLIKEGKTIGDHWFYFKKMLTNDIDLAKEAHAKAPKRRLVAAKPKSAMTDAMWDEVNPKWKALSDAERDALVTETKTYLTPVQIAVKQAVQRQAKDLYAEKLGYPVLINWKSSTAAPKFVENSKESTTEDGASLAAILSSPKPASAAAASKAWEKLNSGKKAGWCYTAEKELRKSGYSAELTEHVIEIQAKSMYIQSLGAVSPLEVD